MPSQLQTSSPRRPWVRRLLVIGLAACGLAAAAPASAQNVNLSNLPAHPRLLLRNSLLPTLRAEMAAGQRKAAMFDGIEDRASGYMTGALSGTYYKTKSLALVGILNNDQAMINRAVRELMYYVRTTSWDPERYDNVISYDWLYNYMTSAQRDSVVDKALLAYPMAGQRTVYYNLEANEATYDGLAGLAFYGDGNSSQNALCQQLVNAWDGRERGVGIYAWPNGSAASLGGVLPARQYYFSDGGYYKGGHYGQKDMEGTTYYLYIFRDLGLGDHWNLCGSYMDGLAEYFLRITRPDANFARIMSGNTFNLNMRAYQAFSIIASARNHRLAAWIVDQGPWEGGSSAYNWPYAYVLWRPNVPTEGPAGLARGRFYGVQGTTNDLSGSWAERVVTRTDWTLDNTDSDGVFFNMISGDYFGDFQSYYQLSFEIYYRGALAIRSGAYGMGEHTSNYYHSSVSNNVTVVLDRTQTGHDIWGQDYLYDEPGRPTHIREVADNSVYNTADVDRYEMLPEGFGGYDAYYVKAAVNPGNAYRNTNRTRKVQVQEREVFWTGRHFIVSDRVEVGDPSNSVRWLLHTINEPAMTSGIISTTVPGHIVTHGRGTWTALRTEDAYDGKITVTPLLPANATLRKVGGAGYEAWVDNGQGSGTNYPLEDPTYYTGREEAGQWRVETIAPAGAATDFVHYIYVSRPGQGAPVAEAIDGDNAVGAQVSGLGVFVFGRDGAGSQGLQYNVLGEDMLRRNTVGGLDGNLAYTVRTEAEGTRVLTASAAGVLSFETREAGPVVIEPVPFARLEVPASER